jgi:hypothetical protein
MYSKASRYGFSMIFVSLMEVSTTAIGSELRAKRFDSDSTL